MISKKDQKSEAIWDQIAITKQSLNPEGLIVDSLIAVTKLVEMFFIYLEEKFDGQEDAPSNKKAEDGRTSPAPRKEKTSKPSTKVSGKKERKASEDRPRRSGPLNRKV